MHSRQKNASKDNEASAQVIEAIKYQTADCVRCGNMEMENTEHIFTCTANEAIWTQTADKLIKVISDRTQQEYRNLPFWFSNKYPVWFATNEEENTLNNFDKILVYVYVLFHY